MQSWLTLKPIPSKFPLTQNWIIPCHIEISRHLMGHSNLTLTSWRGKAASYTPLAINVLMPGKDRKREDIMQPHESISPSFMPLLCHRSHTVSSAENTQYINFNLYRNLNNARGLFSYCESASAKRKFQTGLQHITKKLERGSFR